MDDHFPKPKVVIKALMLSMIIDVILYMYRQGRIQKVPCRGAQPLANPPQKKANQCTCITCYRLTSYKRGQQEYM